MTSNIDQQAARAFQESINCSLFADDVTDLTERFAAHRRRERERIVGMIDLQIVNETNQCKELETSMAYVHGYAAEVLKTLKHQLESKA